VNGAQDIAFARNPENHGIVSGLVAGWPLPPASAGPYPPDVRAARRYRPIDQSVSGSALSIATISAIAAKADWPASRGRFLNLCDQYGLVNFTGCGVRWLPLIHWIEDGQTGQDAKSRPESFDACCG
jgi:hypothetical protein